MQHSFDISIATKYGINVAIFLSNLSFWIQKNMANKKHFHEGRYWTYNSVDAYSILFPYLTKKQIRTTIDKCAELGLILKDNFNDNHYDRTIWYSLSDKGAELIQFPICPSGQIDSTRKANEIAPMGNSSYTDIKPDIKPERAPARKKRAPLPVDFTFNRNNIKLCQEKKLNPTTVLIKFTNKMKSIGRYAEDWDAEANLWIIREKNSIETKNEEIRPTLRDYTQERIEREEKEKSRIYC